MNIVSSGGRFQVYGESVKTYAHLPVAYYNVDFSKMSGFFLTSRCDLTVAEEKIYGSALAKVEKAMRSYRLSNRNFGVLLSGQKGIGKSLFVRLLAMEAIKGGVPVIVVSHAIPGLANFISSIEQDCVVVFDEFEKIFAKQEDWNPQNELLPLFDGIDGGHKLFVVTCNELKDLSQYMINRPGRFHYHFSLTAPSPDEVRQYLTDKVLPEYSVSIEDVVNLSCVVDMPYDYLRAIAFDLNQGYSIREVMSDLNITRTDRVAFDLKLYLSNGLCYEAWNVYIDLSDHSVKDVWFRRFNRSGAGKKDFFEDEVCAGFLPADAHMAGSEYIINEHINANIVDMCKFDGMSEEEAKEAKAIADSVKPERIVLTKVSLSPARYYAV